MIVSLMVGLFGGLIGSFLNVVVYRVPRGLSIVNPPSACPTCGMQITPRDNVPVLSWLALRGRCRGCSSAISARYPLVEAGTALFFGVVALRFIPEIVQAPSTPSLVAGLIAMVAFLWLAGSSVALALIDLDVHRLPNAIVFPLYTVGAILLTVSSVIAGDGEALVRAGIGFAVLGGVYLVLATAVRGGMGGGDVKLAGALGLYLAWLGWPALAVGGISAFIAGGLYGLILIVIRRAQRGTSVPFGPWMLAGAWLGILAGAPIASAYLHMIGLGV